MWWKKLKTPTEESDKCFKEIMKNQTEKHDMLSMILSSFIVIIPMSIAVLLFLSFSCLFLFGLL